jgi:hypothetical protein
VRDEGVGEGGGGPVPQCEGGGPSAAGSGAEVAGTGDSR